MLAIHTLRVHRISAGVDCCSHPTLPYRSTEMTQSMRFFLSIFLAAASLASTSLLNTAGAATAEDLNADSRQALQSLYKANPFSETIAHKAKAILVFPKIIKAGL